MISSVLVKLSRMTLYSGRPFIFTKVRFDTATTILRRLSVRTGTKKMNVEGLPIHEMINVISMMPITVPAGIKMKTFRKLAEAMYIALDHYDHSFGSRGRRIKIVLLDAYHECGHRCIKRLYNQVLTLKKILTRRDFLVFCFVFNLFCDHSLIVSNEAWIRLPTARRMLPIILKGKFDTDTSQDTCIYRQNFPMYRRTKFFKTCNEIYEKNVNDYAFLFDDRHDPNFNRSSAVDRTREARKVVREVFRKCASMSTEKLAFKRKLSNALPFKFKI